MYTVLLFNPGIIVSLDTKLITQLEKKKGSDWRQEAGAGTWLDIY